MRAAVVTNLDEKKRMGSKDHSELRFEQVFENMQDGICIINEFGNIQYINDAYNNMFRVSNPAEVGKNIFQVFHDDVILTAYREKRPVKGNLSGHYSIHLISVAASPIFHNDVFKGVMAIYREELFSEKAKKKETVIELSTAAEKTQEALNNNFQQIIGKSKIMERALLIAQKASKTSSTVLIRGESGTGKELVAKAIHFSSDRCSKPFVKVNCGAIPGSLLESELFGHEQGAFTGAIRKKIGKFEQANTGTIFLDEIGDMPMEMQVKLLRVLQEREFERVGGEETLRCDVRIVAATNRNLEELIDKGSFREDLYYRLNVIPIYLPALKERREDIPVLVRHFLDKINGKLGKSIQQVAPEVEEAFFYYDWPGNIRELENLMERLIALVDGDQIELKDIPSHISNLYTVHYQDDHQSSLINMDWKGELATLEEYEKEIIEYAIKRFGSFNAAGKALGVTHKTVAFKARKYKIIE
ncbi:PAS domain S-box-containing protein [Geosporobacter subterraneus DSM 17957]|uniref:HTH-type transcriptional regulatory protein TyrR n=1 Tax=Geosporobacter subterraneus DSM 17957 TaxID=1121919 RepID=A0A1M6J415_9FIRM|nr:sigma 54-interacting transcriptional regulator [Geosporobacter subterraneus]SHJ41341.1 PAS domain S-box-containing protein [Geosporobacter subterraneus DSM 17957]